MVISDLTETLAPIFESIPNAVVVYLFGSLARGQAGPLSDVDLAVLLSDQPDEHACFEARLDIAGQVMTGLQRNDVDMAILNQSPLALRYRVIRDGQIVFCRDHTTRIAFTAQTLMAYLDYQPVLKVFEQATLNRARKGELTRGYNPHYGAVERYRRLRQSLARTSTTDLR